MVDAANAIPPREPLGDAVHVWQARLADWEPQAARLAAWLSPDEQARMSRFREPALAARYGIGRGLLRGLLAGYLGAAPADLVFAVNEYGKPALLNAPADSLHFNVSHTDVLLMLALSGRGPVGVDVEQVHTAPVSIQEIRRVLSADEQAQWLSLPGLDLAASFYRVWVRKEAVLKAMGVGLAIEPDTFSVGMGSFPTITQLRGVPLRVHDLEMAGPIKAALAVIGLEMPDIIRRYDLTVSALAASALPR